jgi:hypothetical protein
LGRGWRERQETLNEIMGEDKGLGQTLSIISLVVASKKADGVDREVSETNGDDNRITIAVLRLQKEEY